MFITDVLYVRHDVALVRELLFHKFGMLLQFVSYFIFLENNLISFTPRTDLNQTSNLLNNFTVEFLKIILSTKKTICGMFIVVLSA